jgi:hypothetical protein
MPVRIRNLFIVAHITSDDGKKNAKSGAGKQPCEGCLDEETKNQIIEESVQQVLEILERQKDR